MFTFKNKIMSMTYRVTLLLIALSGWMTLQSQILEEEQNLEGTWRFSIGDDKQWKNPEFDDSNWLRINVPTSWESQGFDGYNGYAWYRKTVIKETVPNNEQVLKIGGIDDADEVYLNGYFVGRSGSFPPRIQTAWNKEREYVIPKSYWKKGKNILAIKVYDFYNIGGIYRGPVKLFRNVTHDLLSIDLSGKWLFATGRVPGAELTHYNDYQWQTINVPGRWEDQGWSNYDGEAWYRKNFRIPLRLQNQSLVLFLGKIDDEDQTWLNGQKIGAVKRSSARQSMAKSWSNSSQPHTIYRAYRIPQGLLSASENNVISIRVSDFQLDGGIYQGPVGILTEEQFRRLEKLIEKDPTVLDIIFEWLNN
jgi:sialate O-acetylesterase